MKVKYVGIKLKSNAKDISTESYYDELERLSGKIFEGTSSERHLFFNNSISKEYFYGLVVTLKDQKRFCKANMYGGEITLKAEDLLEDDKLVDFNFLAIRKDTNKGVFQYYHNSCSPSVFGDMCKKIFYEKKEFLIKKEYEKLAPNQAAYVDVKAHAKAKKKYSGRPFFAILVDDRDIEKIIRSYSEVKSLDVTFQAVESPTDSAIAAKQLSDTVTVKYRFEVKQDVNNIAEAASQLLKRVGFVRGKAQAVDEFGEERMINLLNCPYDFGQEEFDELASRVDALKASEFTGNDILKDLEKILKDRNYAPTFASVDKD